MTKLSLTRNLNGGVTLDDLRFQFGELVSTLEDYLNSKVDVHIIESNNKTQIRPTFKKGDIVFDLAKSPGIATLQQWNGKKLVPLGFDTITGFINLIERGIGSGTNRTMLLASNGNGGWELRLPNQIVLLTNSDAAAAAVGEVFYIFSSDSVKKAKADAAATTAAYYFATTIITAGTNGIFQSAGIITGLSGLTPGATYYLSATTAGAMIVTAPTTLGQYIVRLGKALSATEFQIRIEPEILL